MQRSTGEPSGSVLHPGKGGGCPNMHMYDFIELYTKLVDFIVCKLYLYKADFLFKKSRSQLVKLENFTFHQSKHILDNIYCFDWYFGILIKYIPVRVFNSFLLPPSLPSFPFFPCSFISFNISFTCNLKLCISKFIPGCNTFLFRQILMN